MLLANPKTVAAMEARQIEAEKKAGKGSAKKGSKADAKDPYASLPSVADLLQLSSDSTIAAAGLGSIDFSMSPMQQQQSKGTELLLARRPQAETSPPPPPPKSKSSPSPKRGDPSPPKHAASSSVPKLAASSSSPSKPGRPSRDKSASPTKG